MVKSYLRYSEGACLGIVCSGSAVDFDSSGQQALVAALSSVILWNLRTGAKIRTFRDPNTQAEVTAICRSPDSQSVAAGYNDGSVRIWTLKDGECAVTFFGHRKAVTSLCFNRVGNILASASKDTDIVLWDIVAEAGQCRLQGHNDAVTSVKFLEFGPTLQLLSCSKDTLAKLWDVETRHCVQTLVGHRSEVWSLDVSEDESRVVTGGSDAELRVWGWSDIAGGERDEADEGTQQSASKSRELNFLGILPRVSRARVAHLNFDQAGVGVLAVQSADKTVEVFRARGEKDVAKKLKRREKRRREKAKLLQQRGDAGAETDVLNAATTVDPALEFEHVCVIRAETKIRSFVLGPKLHKAKAGSTDKALPLLLVLGNNQLEQHDLQVASKSAETKKRGGICLPGHRNDIRAVCLSSDDELLLSCSHQELKLWNLRSQACVRTIETGYGLCGIFLPGDRQVLIGTKSGQLELYDLGASARLETVDAHAGAIWSLGARPAGRSGEAQQIATGSADHDVKFWDIELTLDEEWSATQKRVTLACVRTLTMQEDVLALKYSPDAKLLAVSLLDATVKIFYEDSLKFFISLYGHKLPVMAMDISSDSRLIATGSADKNIKIWGLDFGDCHKSIFAHSDAVMALAFVPNTHYMFSAGKDKLIKYWDCDKFEQIIAMHGHHGEVSGGISYGHDHSV